MDFWTFYAIMGIATALFGGYRWQKGKQGTEPDYLYVLTWVLFWPLYLGMLFYALIKKGAQMLVKK